MMDETDNLLADEAGWQRTFDAVPDLMLVLDNEHRIVRANRAATERLGCPAEGLVGQFCHVVMHGTDRPPDSCPHSLLLRDGQSRTVEVYEPRAGGHFAVSVTPLTDGRGEMIGAVHVARDVTELKRIETELRCAREQIEQRHALTVAAMRDGLWEGDLATDHVLYSDRYLELLGYQREETSSTIDFFKDILHLEDAQSLWQAVERTLAERKPHEVEFRLRTKAGEYRWFLTRGQAQWDAAGQPMCMAGAIQDITDRKQAEAAREDLARFERLLADISARFVGAAPEGVDAEITCAIEGIRRFFQVDQIAFLKYDTDSSHVMHPSHWAAADGVPAIPTDLNGRLLFPWIHDQLRSGTPLIVRRASARPVGLPLDGVRDPITVGLTPPRSPGYTTFHGSLLVAHFHRVWLLAAGR